MPYELLAEFIGSELEQLGKFARRVVQAAPDEGSRWLRYLLKRTPITLDLRLKISQHFEVSLEAVQIRLKELRIID
jgi:hypothetical protein